MKLTVKIQKNVENKNVETKETKYKTISDGIQPTKIIVTLKEKRFHILSTSHTLYILSASYTLQIHACFAYFKSLLLRYIDSGDNEGTQKRCDTSDILS